MADERPIEEGLELTGPEKKKAADLVKFGQIPDTLGGAWMMAQVYAKSEMIPKDYRQRPHDIMAVWDMAYRLGFGPLQALQTIANINGRPGVWGDGLLAICQSAPKYRDHDEYYLVDGQRRELHEGLSAADLAKDDTKAVSLFYVQGREKPYGASFSIAQAKRAGLTNKRETPWQTYPERMLLWRARGFSARDAFPADLRGLKGAEELLDTPIDTTAVHVETVPEPTRKSEQAAKAAAAESTSERVDLPAGTVVHAATGKDVVLTQDTSAVKGETKPQPGKVYTGAPETQPANGEPKAANGGTPEPKSRFGIGQVIVSEGTILETQFVPDAKPGAHLPLDQTPSGVTEVTATITAGKRKETATFLTDVASIAATANSCAGTDTPLKLQWGSAKYNGKTVRVLTGLTGF